MRHYNFQGIRPFFCQVEAVETAIWLMEVAPKSGKKEKAFLEHIQTVNHEANPDVLRVCLKLATGAGKTTVMAMRIAWQTLNACGRTSGSIWQYLAVSGGERALSRCDCVGVVVGSAGL